MEYIIENFSNQIFFSILSSYSNNLFYIHYYLPKRYRESILLSSLKQLYQRVQLSFQRDYNKGFKLISLTRSKAKKGGTVVRIRSSWYTRLGLHSYIYRAASPLEQLLIDSDSSANNGTIAVETAVVRRTKGSSKC